jgi:thioredoxin reductase (NADPH)
MPSAPPALARLGGYALKDRPVAMIVSDQRMPTMTGIELLERAKREAPEAKLVLLTAYADTDVAIKAINDIKLDRYLMKPWDPPDDKLYPAIDDLLDDWQRNHPDDRAPVRIVGHRWSERSHELKTFLARNYVPYRWLDLERDEEAQRLHDLARAAGRSPAGARHRRRSAEVTDHTRRRVRARLAYDRREAAVRPLHRGSGARRARCRGV